MRSLVGAGLTGAALILLAACGKPATNGAAAPAAAPAPAGPATAASGPPASDQLPHRKSGLWEQTMSLAGAPAGQIPSTRICVDEVSETKMSVLGRHAPGAQCAAPRVTRNPDGSMTFSSQCDMGRNGQSRTQGTISGDLQSAYTITMVTSISGSAIPAMNHEMKMTVSSRWLGACEPGQKGGDMILPGGMRVNALQGEPPGPAPAGR